MSEKIAIDIGYGDVKINYKGKNVKFPTAISFFTDNGIRYGEQKIYDFEGEKYVVGSEGKTEAFSTTNYDFLYKYAPLIIYHILSKFDEVNKQTPIEIRTGLALVDWDKKDNFIERISNFIVNDEEINLNVKVVPQGVGIYLNFAKNGTLPEDIEDEELKNLNVAVIDIGFNTINILNMKNGKFIPSNSKSYPGHGVSSLIKPFRDYLENKFKDPFSEQEANEILYKGYFRYNGKKQKDIEEYIKDAKRKFIIKIFGSVLVESKKVFSLADLVILSGGGSNFFEGVKLKDNMILDNSTIIDGKPRREFSNVNGYYTL